VTRLLLTASMVGFIASGALSEAHHEGLSGGVAIVALLLSFASAISAGRTLHRKEG